PARAAGAAGSTRAAGVAGGHTGAGGRARRHLLRLLGGGGRDGGDDQQLDGCQDGQRGVAPRERAAVHVDPLPLLATGATPGVPVTPVIRPTSSEMSNFLRTIGRGALLPATALRPRLRGRRPDGRPDGQLHVPDRGPRDRRGGDR